MGQYYHLFANGDDARDFITSIDDFAAAFNRVAVCACAYPDVRILAFSIEESHPHFLLFGLFEDCLGFKHLYESQTYFYIISSRGSKDGVVFELEISEVTDEEYLLNVASYVIVQPTKDGKRVLPYDYYWGTGSMYFRPEGLPPRWCYDSEWRHIDPVKYGSLSVRARRKITHSTIELPNEWLICNGLVLPINYVDIKQFEGIFHTHNRFRTFLSAGRKQLQTVVDGMAAVRGVSMEDLEARDVARAVSERLFGKKDARWLTQSQRLTLATALRNNYRISIRQVATLSRLPESEIRKYLK